MPEATSASRPSGRLTPARVTLLYAALSALWIVASGYLLNLATADPALLARFELAKGLAFVAVTSILLYLLLRLHASQAEITEEAVALFPGKRRLAAIFVALALVAPLIGFGIVRLYGPQIEHQTLENLRAIADLKSRQIENWVSERIGDGTALTDSKGFIDRVAELQRSGSTKESEIIRIRLDLLVKVTGYESVVLLDAQGRQLASLGLPHPMDDLTRQLMGEALADGRVRHAGLHGDADGRLHVGVIAPLLHEEAGRSRPIGAVVLHMNPARFLFPYVQSWPGTSASAETLLVRREGDQVAFLNELRHRPVKALTMQLPASEAALPAAVAVRESRPGVASGTDYRGVPVLAALRPVAGTDWHLVAKIDREEALAPVRDLATWVSLVAFMAVAAIGVAVLMLWRQQQRAHRLSLQVKTAAIVRQSEARYRAATESAGDAIVSADAAGNIVGWNPSAARLFGYAEGEALGQPLTLLMPRELRQAHIDGMARLHAGGAPRVIGTPVELTGRHKEGGEFPVELSLARWQTDEGVFYTGILRGIAERKRTDLLLRRQKDLYDTLSQTNQTIVRCGDQFSLFTEICRIAVEHGRFRFAWIGVLDADSFQILPRARFGEDAGYIDKVHAARPADGQGVQGLAMEAARTGAHAISNDFLEDAAMAPWHAEAARAGVRAAGAFPIRRAGTVTGTLNLYAAEPGYFDEAVVNTLDEMATDISFALDNLDRSAALAAAEEQFRGLVEQAIAGIYIIQDGRLAYVNQRCADILGYAKADALTGADPLQLVSESDRAQTLEHMQRLIDGVVQSLTFEFTALRQDGTAVNIGLHGARATHRGRQAIIGLMQDISEKKRAEEQIARYVKQLEGAFMHTVEVATTLSEMRDPYTAGHEKRVAQIAVAIGAELGYDERGQEGLRVSGYLHDVGKITIPAEILSKPGRLSEVEFEMIKGHSRASYDVLKEVEFPWPVAEIALQHHERMDGSGYPLGLKGETILPGARILAVADVVEAMSSHRPYRAGLGIDAALAEIERGRGTAYDSAVADACLNLFRGKGYTLPN